MQLVEELPQWFLQLELTYAPLLGPVDLFPALVSPLDERACLVVLPLILFISGFLV